MADRMLLTALEEEIKKHVPKFEVKAKKDSFLMRFIQRILFFNKGFATDYITTVGQKVYWPSLEQYEADPSKSFNTLAHEFVHIMDYLKNPFLFVFKYLFPQILAIPSVLFVLLLPLWIMLMALSIMSPWWLLMLIPLVFLAPIPSPGRKEAELRGYGMSCRVRVWRFGSVSDSNFNHYVGAFTGPAYYFMWPFKKSITKQLSEFRQQKSPSIVYNDTVPVWKSVYKVLEENGALK